MEPRGGSGSCSSAAISDEYLATARQVLEGCGMDGDGVLPVNALMNKLAPYVPADKTEDLHGLLDPERVNPAIGAPELAAALEKYGERHNLKPEFDESINMRNSHTPIDSDSGISTDMGYQLVDEIQNELRDKRQCERRWRLTLDAAERAHEDAIAAVVAERDSLRAHLQLMREENCSLTRLRAECEESGERLQRAEAALQGCARELETASRKLRAAHEAIDKLETERVTLESLLAKSKEECHRINDMYAARQATLLEENETYKSDYADLSTRYQEQEDYLQQALKEKVRLEMEMSDVLNKSSRAAAVPLDRSCDVSYTDAQLLRALDSLNLCDSRENLSQDELYISDTNVERGRPSLFDELLRVDSFHRHLPDFDDRRKCDKITDKDSSRDDDSYSSVATQTEDVATHPCEDIEAHKCDSVAIQTEIGDDTHSIAVQTEIFTEISLADVSNRLFNAGTQTDLSADIFNNNRASRALEPCSDCAAKKSRVKELEACVARSEKIIENMRLDLDHYEVNLTVLQSNFDSVEEKNKRNQSVIELFRKKVDILDGALTQRMSLTQRRSVGACCSVTQTSEMTSDTATQADVACAECETRSNAGNIVATRPSRVRSFIWNTLKGLLQLLAVVCLCAAVLFLYNVSHYSYASRRCVRGGGAVPWQWMRVDDLLDLLFRVEYVGEIPM